MRRQKEIVDLDLTKINYRNIVDYDGSTLADYIITDDAKVYHKEEDGKYSVINPYLNTTSNERYSWKNGYYKIRVNKSLYNLHWLLARAFVPGYKCGLVAHHKDGNSTHNFADNLEWVSRSEHLKHHWASLSQEELTAYKEKYSNAVKQAHQDGKYKQHLNKLHNKEGE